MISSSANSTHQTFLNYFNNNGRGRAAIEQLLYNRTLFSCRVGARTFACGEQAGGINHRVISVIGSLIH